MGCHLEGSGMVAWATPYIHSSQPPGAREGGLSLYSLSRGTDPREMGKDSRVWKPPPLVCGILAGGKRDVCGQHM